MGQAQLIKSFDFHHDKCSQDQAFYFLSLEMTIEEISQKLREIGEFGEEIYSKVRIIHCFTKVNAYYQADRKEAVFLHEFDLRINKSAQILLQKNYKKVALKPQKINGCPYFLLQTGKAKNFEFIGHVKKQFYLKSAKKLNLQVELSCVVQDEKILFSELSKVNSKGTGTFFERYKNDIPVMKLIKSTNSRSGIYTSINCLRCQSTTSKFKGDLTSSRVEFSSFSFESDCRFSTNKITGYLYSDRDLVQSPTAVYLDLVQL